MSTPSLPTDRQIDSDEQRISEEDELSKFIINEYLPFKDELELCLRRFRSYKHDILVTLFNGYSPTKPSHKHETAWSQIQAIAYRCAAREILKKIIVDQAARYNKLCGISKATRVKIEKLRYAQGHPAHLVIKSWLDGVNDLQTATEEFEKLLYTLANCDRHIDGALKTLVLLEAASRNTASLMRRARGRPEGTSILPRRYFFELECIYRRTTGRDHTDEDGVYTDEFTKFADEFIVAIGMEEQAKEDYLYESRKYTLRKKRKSRS